MESIRGGLPAGSLSLSPTFVLWAAICFILLLIAGSIAWLVLHDPLLRGLRRLWLGDLVVAWLLYAALYQLSILAELRLLQGRPWGVWSLWVALGSYILLRRVRTPLRRPAVAFGVAIVLWAGVIAAGQRFVAETAADAALLAAQPEAVLRLEAPRLRPLRRVLLLTRVDADTRAASLHVLAMLEGAIPPDADQVTAFRVARVPLLLEAYARDLAKLRTYQWLQGGLLAVVLLLWGLGRVPEWEAL